MRGLVGASEKASIQRMFEVALDQRPAGDAERAVWNGEPQPLLLALLVFFLALQLLFGLLLFSSDSFRLWLRAPPFGIGSLR